MKHDELYNIVTTPIIDNHSEIPPHIQRKMIDFIFENFIQHFREGLTCLYSGQVKPIPSKLAFEDVVHTLLLKHFKGIKLKIQDKETYKIKWDFNINMLYNVLKSYNHYQNYTYKNNLFADKPTIQLDEIRQEITITQNKISLKHPRLTQQITRETKELIVMDYKQHFPQIDEVLSLIMDMRIAKNRKGSFLHIRANRSWGKSFFSMILQSIGCSLEVDYENFLNTNSNSISPQAVRNSFVLVLDEFTEFKPEMKKHTHNFQFAPKFGMRESIEIYLKILFSADKSESFEGGVSEQIQSRVMIIDTMHQTPLDIRAVFRKKGTVVYALVLQEYFYNALLNRLREYLKMDEIEAINLADKQVTKAYNNWGMLANKKVLNLGDSVKDTLIRELFRIVNDYKGYMLSDIPPQMRDIRDLVVLIEEGKHTGRFFIQRTFKTLDTILKYSLTRMDYLKSRAELNDLDNLFGKIHATYYVRPDSNGHGYRGIIIDAIYDETTPLLEEDSQGNVIRETTIQYQARMNFDT